MNLISKLLDWLRATIGVKRDSAQPTYLESYTYNGCTLRLLFDQVGPFPGLVCLWECIEPTAQYDLIVLCLNIAQFKEGFISAPPTTYRQEWRRAFEVKAHQEIRRQRGVRHASHLLFIAWRSRIPSRSRFVNGQLERYCHLDLQHCFAVNLQSNVGALELFVGQNHYATRIVRALVFRCLKMGSTPHNTWQELVLGIPWLVWLDFYARKSSVKISSDHVIQPGLQNNQ